MSQTLVGSPFKSATEILLVHLHVGAGCLLELALTLAPLNAEHVEQHVEVQIEQLVGQVAEHVFEELELAVVHVLPDQRLTLVVLDLLDILQETCHILVGGEFLQHNQFAHVVFLDVHFIRVRLVYVHGDDVAKQGAFEHVDRVHSVPAFGLREEGEVEVVLCLGVALELQVYQALEVVEAGLDAGVIDIS